MKESLIKRLEDANEAYRNGTPIMSDAAYDALEDKLRRVDPTNAWFKRTGAPAPVNGSWPKVAHTIPMRSLNKAGTEEEFLAWWPNAPSVLMDKLDGASVQLTYQGGKLRQAATRGDGAVGENITRNVLLMKGVPHTIKNTGLVQVRGEIVVTREDFALHFEGESNPRNTASGTAKRQSDPEKCAHLTVIAYQLFEDGETLPSKEDELRQLRDLGFDVVSWYSVETAQEVFDIYRSYIKGVRDAAQTDIDGLVIEVSDRVVRERMGEKNNRPAGAVALKFPHDNCPTILRDVIWQVGKSGRITPVAVFDEVDLAGAKVKRASLHNLDQIERLLENTGQTVLSEGDLILASRRNDVIPAVEEVIQVNEAEDARAFEHPVDCPVCGSKTEREGAYLVCPNTLSCPAQVSGAVKRWVEKIGVKFFGEGLIDALCDQGLVSSIADVYKLDEEEVASLTVNGRFIGASAERGFDSLRQNKELPLHVFIGALGIPQIGRSMVKIIMDGGVDTLPKMLSASTATLARIDKVGESKADAFYHGIRSLEALGVLADLEDVGIKIKTPSVGNLTGKSVCMSGFRDAKMTAAIEAKGGTIKASVGKGLTYLVVKDPASTSGKAAKARQLGVNVIGIDEMWKILK